MKSKKFRSLSVGCCAGKLCGGSRRLFGGLGSPKWTTSTTVARGKAWESMTPQELAADNQGAIGAVDKPTPATALVALRGTTFANKS